MGLQTYSFQSSWIVSTVESMDWTTSGRVLSSVRSEMVSD